MSASTSSQCVCVDSSYCRCTNSRWYTQPLQPCTYPAQHMTPVLQQYQSVYPQQYSISGPSLMQQPTGSYLQPGHFSHHALTPSPQLSERLLASQTNSIPFPTVALCDTTAATVNISRQNQPTTTAKGKHTVNEPNRNRLYCWSRPSSRTLAHFASGPYVLI